MRSIEKISNEIEFCPTFNIRSTKLFQGKPDLWLWLGDNMYKDGTNLDAKREKYNLARDEASYVSHGPVAEPKMPVMATWDDHDYASNNLGNDYPCKLESQDEFVTHFNIPESDPRHKNYRLFLIKPEILGSIFSYKRL